MISGTASERRQCCDAHKAACDRKIEAEEADDKIDNTQAEEADAARKTTLLRACTYHRLLQSHNVLQSCPRQRAPL